MRMLLGVALGVAWDCFEPGAEPGAEQARSQAGSPPRWSLGAYFGASGEVSGGWPLGAYFGASGGSKSRPKSTINIGQSRKPLEVEAGVGGIGRSRETPLMVFDFQSFRIIIL